MRNLIALIFLIPAVSLADLSKNAVTVFDIQKSIRVYDDVQDDTKLDSSYYTLEDPNEFDELREMEKRVYIWYSNYHTLLQNFANNRLSKHELEPFIENTDYANDSEKAYLLAKLFHLMVEVDSPLLVKEQFQTIFEAVNITQINVSVAEFQLVECSYAYTKRDVRLLTKIVEEKTQIPYVDGYCSLKRFELTDSTTDLATTIDLLEQSPGEGDPDGRLSLHLATAYTNLLSRTKKPTQDELNKAIGYAREARQKLELLEVPYLWTAAHLKTSQLYDVVPGDDAKQISNRAHLLSTQN